MVFSRQHNWQYLNLLIHEISQLNQYLTAMDPGLILRKRGFFATSSAEVIINLNYLSSVC